MKIIHSAVTIIAPAIRIGIWAVAAAKAIREGATASGRTVKLITMINTIIIAVALFI
tara:strand:+ start:852 stop:1022 length:171 start_codon:yes stop_codon:yes gene_type:complete